jgi:hypothetical protein
MFPPITARTLMAPTCTTAYFEPLVGPEPSPVQGVLDLLTGETDMPALNLVIQVNLGGACVDCQGDITPRDGMRQGVCMGTTTACDTNGRSLAVTASVA